MKPTNIIFFLIVVTSVYFGLHYYLYTSLTKDLQLGIGIRRMIIIMLFLGGLLYYAGQILERMYGLHGFSYAGSIWLGFISIGFFIFILKDVSLFFPVPRHTAAYGALLLTLLLGGFSLYHAAKPPNLVEHQISVRNFPKGQSGFTILQLSDIHLDGYKSEAWLSGIVEQVNQQHPDLIVMTGDIVDAGYERVDRFLPILQQLDSTHGVYAVSGNHEFYAGIEDFYRLMEQADIRVLKNERMPVGDILELVGIHDDTSKRFGIEAADLENLLKDTHPEKSIVLLSHKPVDFEKAAALGVDLQLSGHTHGGQIPPMNLLVKLAYQYAHGLYQKDESYIYTSSGTGFWGPPMRLFTSPEVVKLTLVGKASD
ncbi:metallophosphoesterase [Geosporobacter ferrireducens]|uniref:Calcineurin-like phosphoesterase domain-containing protein n=1 Tax=Geosporobacter ferrireducens TaxID=1424294 RepID=A0A1D8GPP2_9FIRM|nr:metallophosphoesterase [Geosporobacter ferrireducens]AOT72877.1 hypothetical protein Gferi_26965 [Geosporobacter ferrireducens]MTI55283.1 metallophosphoesterase [Geosporobacter ferrireducens]